MVEIKDFFFEYAPWLILLPTIVAVLNHKKYSNELRIILYYLLLSVFSQTAAFIFWKANINNLPILHVFTLLEFLILLRFYSILLTKIIPTAVFLFLALAFPLFAIFDSVLLENIFTFNTLARSFEALIFIFLSISWFLKIVSKEENASTVSYKGINYINGGFFIYFSGSIALFSFSNYINQLAHSLLMNIWTIHTLLLVFLYLAITSGLWICRIK